MANTPKPKSSFIDDVLAFVKDKKKLLLLLLLLGGTATVVTTAAVLLSSPGNSNNSQASSGLISGNEVPNLDFDKATLTASGNGIGARYDYRTMDRYQNDFYLQTGLNFFDGASGLTSEHTESAFSVYNVRTAEILFQYTFDLGDAHRAAVLDGSANNYLSELRIAFDGESTIFITLNTRFPATIAGSYTPLKTHAMSKFSTISNSDYFQFLLAFDINDNSTYTILDSRRSNQSDFYMNDLLYENDRLYIGASYGNPYLENPANGNEENFFDFLTIPTDIPTLTFVNQQPDFTNYILEVSVEGTTLEVIDMTPFTSNYGITIWFTGYQQGFETRYFTEEGQMVLTASFYNNNASTDASSISTFFDTFEATFLTEDSSVLVEAETESLAAHEAVLDTPNGDSFDYYSFNLRITGFFNFETGLFDHAINGYNVYGSNNVGGVIDRAEASKWPTLFLTDSGDSFLIDYDIVTNWEGQSSQIEISQLNPERLVDAVSTLSRYNLETGEKTVVIEHDNNGTFLSGIYETSDGYYLTGSYYATDANEIDSVDAFLVATNDAFVTQQELILSGSGDDMGQGIMLNASGRPVWIVMSKSTDGDFEGLDGDEDRFSSYFVSF